MTSSLRAACEACGKTYRVPTADRTYTCKACEGVVRVLEEPKLEPRPAPTAHGPMKADQRAARDLRGAQKSIRAVRIFYVLTAVFLALAAWLVAAAGPDVRTIQIIAICFALAAGVAVAGSILVAQQPFFWGLVMGMLVTPVTGFLLIEFGLSLVSLFMMVVVVATWGALPSLSKVTGILRSHPDLYAAHRLLGTGLARGGRHRGRDLSAEEQREVLAASARKARFVSAGAALGAFALAAAPVFVNRGPADGPRAQARAPVETTRIEAGPIEPSIGKFVDAWAASDAVAVAALFPDTHAAKMQLNIKSTAETRGWEGGYPELLGWEATPVSEASTQVDFELAEGRLITRWLVDEEGQWVLAMLQPPRPGQ